MSEKQVNKVIDQLLKDASNYLFISTTPDYVKVGPYQIKQDRDVFALSYNNRIVEHLYDKKAAIAYAVTLYNRQSSKSKIIKEYDEKIGKYRNDIKFYRRSLVLAEKRRDTAKQDIVENRLEVAFDELSVIKTSLLREIKNIELG